MNGAFTPLTCSLRERERQNIRCGLFQGSFSLREKDRMRGQSPLLLA